MLCTCVRKDFEKGGRFCVFTENLTASPAHVHGKRCPTSGYSSSFKTLQQKLHSVTCGFLVDGSSCVLHMVWELLATWNVTFSELILVKLCEANGNTRMRVTTQPSSEPKASEQTRVHYHISFCQLQWTTASSFWSLRQQVIHLLKSRMSSQLWVSGLLLAGLTLKCNPVKETCCRKRPQYVHEVQELRCFCLTCVQPGEKNAF